MRIIFLLHSCQYFLFPIFLIHLILTGIILCFVVTFICIFLIINNNIHSDMYMFIVFNISSSWKYLFISSPYFFIALNHWNFGVICYLHFWSVPNCLTGTGTKILGKQHEQQNSFLKFLIKNSFPCSFWGSISRCGEMF